MSNELVSIKSTLPSVPAIDRHVRGQAARHLRRMVDIAEVTKAAMKEIGELSTFAEMQRIRNLLDNDVWEHLGEVTPEQKQRFAHLKMATCQEFELLALIADHKIISLIDSLPPEVQKDLWHELVDFLSE